MEEKRAIRHLQQDPVFARLIPQLQLTPTDGSGDVFGALIRSIISQQLSVAAAASIHRRVLAHFDGVPDPLALARARDEDLRSLGLSRPKIKYLKNIGASWAEHGYESLDWTTMGDEEIIEALVPLPGVGRWTVEMILLFTLNRPDVFAIDDLIIQKGIAHWWRMRTTSKTFKKRAKKLAERWSPYRSYACRYIWKSKELFAKGPGAPFIT